MSRLAFILILFFVFPFIVFAENSYILEADEIFGTDKNSFTAKGNVKVTFKNSVLTADEATYYHNERRLEAVGNITVKDDEQVITANRITYDLNNETGNIDNVSGILGGEYYFCARKVSRVDKDYYIMEGVRITTCSAPVPDWSFEFAKANIEIDGYLTGDHATANIKDMPVLYLPKLFYPLKVTRQTGLLIPAIGYSSELGTYFSEDFFWAMDYDKDITIGVNAFTERGIHGVSEFRYTPSSKSSVYLTADGINDAESNVEDSGRWRYVSKTILALPYDFEMLVDASNVSDYMYMRNFGEYGLYKPNLKNDENTFYQQLHLKWYSKYSDITLMYRNNEKYSDISEGYIKTKTAMEPYLGMEKTALDLVGLRLDYSLNWAKVRHTDYTYYFTGISDEEIKQYQRYHASARLYKPINLYILTFTPFIKEYYTNWQDFNYNTYINSERKNALSYIYRSGNGYERVLPEFGAVIDLNEIYSYYSDGKHGILNNIEYKYVQKIDQKGLPDYIYEDIIDSEHSLYWTMTNYYKKDKWNVELTLKQGADFFKNDILLPLEIRAELGKEGLFSNKLTSKVDYYGYKNKNSNENINSFEDIFRIYIDKLTFYGKYSYEKDFEVDFNTSAELGGSIRLSNIELGAWVNWKGKNKKISLSKLVPMENSFTFIWHDQCWDIGLKYVSEKYQENIATGSELRRDYKIELSFALKGLGSSGFRAYKETKYYE